MVARASVTSQPKPKLGGKLTTVKKKKVPDVRLCCCDKDENVDPAGQFCEGSREHEIVFQIFPEGQSPKVIKESQSSVVAIWAKATGRQETPVTANTS